MDVLGHFIMKGLNFIDDGDSHIKFDFPTTTKEMANFAEWVADPEVDVVCTIWAIPKEEEK